MKHLTNRHLPSVAVPLRKCTVYQWKNRSRINPLRVRIWGYGSRWRWKPVSLSAVFGSLLVGQTATGDPQLYVSGSWRQTANKPLLTFCCHYSEEMYRLHIWKNVYAWTVSLSAVYGSLLLGQTATGDPEIYVSGQTVHKPLLTFCCRSSEEMYRLPMDNRWCCIGTWR